jgi:hypothetical protein
MPRNRRGTRHVPQRQGFGSLLNELQSMQTEQPEQQPPTETPAKVRLARLAVGRCVKLDVNELLSGSELFRREVPDPELVVCNEATLVYGSAWWMERNNSKKLPHDNTQFLRMLEAIPAAEQLDAAQVASDITVPLTGEVLQEEAENMQGMRRLLAVVRDTPSDHYREGGVINGEAGVVSRRLGVTVPQSARLVSPGDNGLPEHHITLAIASEEFGDLAARTIGQILPHELTLSALGILPRRQFSHLY